MTFLDLVSEAAELDYVREVAVYNDGNMRGMEIRITEGPALNASQALEEPELPSGMSHSGQETKGTYEILAIDEEDNQTRGSSVTPEGRAVKGPLSAEEVLQAVEDMHKEAAGIDPNNR
jgi:hypothetical protein